MTNSAKQTVTWTSIELERMNRVKPGSGVFPVVQDND